MFARVGVPNESNFVSQLLAELYGLLQAKPIQTSLHHPQTDRLVKCFNKNKGHVAEDDI